MHLPTLSMLHIVSCPHSQSRCEATHAALASLPATSCCVCVLRGAASCRYLAYSLAMLLFVAEFSLLAAGYQIVLFVYALQSAPPSRRFWQVCTVQACAMTPELKPLPAPLPRALSAASRCSRAQARMHCKHSKPTCIAALPF